MLPVITANAGSGVFSTICEPYQKPKTISTIKPIITAFWKYSFLQSFLILAVKALPSVEWRNILVHLAVYVLKLTAFKKRKNEEVKGDRNF
jgi:hypothetical protein